MGKTEVEAAMERIATGEEMTYGETLGPAMEITDQDEADRYYEALVQRQMRVGGYVREQAESNVKSNLGYYAGYYTDPEVSKRVNRLFTTEHPIFGKKMPTAGEAFRKGVELGEQASE